MTIRVSVLANCQSSPVASLLRIASSDIEIKPIPAVHTIKNGDTTQIFASIEASDVVVHQPIGKGFGPISSDAIREMFPAKTFVCFPSIYFGGLLPHLAYLRLKPNGTLQGSLGDYHDLRVLRSFLAGQSVEQCLSGLDQFDIAIHGHYAASLQESARREALTDIPVMDLVKERIQRSQTFYTFNHCDNEILWSVALGVLGKLGAKIDGPQKPPMTPLLGNVIAAVPRSILEAMGISWRQDEYLIGGKAIANRDLVSGFFDLYRATDKLDEIVEHNRARFALNLTPAI